MYPVDVVFLRWDGKEEFKRTLLNSNLKEVSEHLASLDSNPLPSATHQIPIVFKLNEPILDGRYKASFANIVCDHLWLEADKMDSCKTESTTYFLKQKFIK